MLDVSLLYLSFTKAQHVSIALITTTCLLCLIISFKYSCITTYFYLTLTLWFCLFSLLHRLSLTCSKLCKLPPQYSKCHTSGREIRKDCWWQQSVQSTHTVPLNLDIFQSRFCPPKTNRSNTPALHHRYSTSQLAEMQRECVFLSH